MELILELNLIDNEDMLKKISLFALGLMLPLMFFFFGVGWLVRDPSGGDVNLLSFSDNFFIDLILFYLIYLVTVVLHEMIHGIFMKLFAPRRPVKFGFTKFAAYAASPGTIYTKGQMSVIALAPFVLISIGYNLLYRYYNVALVSYALLAGLHGASCIGDFYYMWLMIQHSETTHVEDTDEGIKLYRQVATEK